MKNKFNGNKKICTHHTLFNKSIFLKIVINIILWTFCCGIMAPRVSGIIKSQQNNKQNIVFHSKKNKNIADLKLVLLNQEFIPT